MYSVVKESGKIWRSEYCKLMDQKRQNMQYVETYSKTAAVWGQKSHIMVRMYKTEGLRLFNDQGPDVKK